MTATFQFNLIASFPGYDIVSPQMKDYPIYGKVARQMAIPVKAGDVVAIEFKSMRGDTLYDMFTFGSVVSYSEKSDECPIRAVERATERGHELHWMNRNSVCISDSKTEAKPTYTGVIWGNVVRFEGRFFTITRDGNQGHAKLVEVQ